MVSDMITPILMRNYQKNLMNLKKGAVGLNEVPKNSFSNSPKRLRP